MSGNGVSPVDAHLVVRYAPHDGEQTGRSTRRGSIQGTSICVDEPCDLEPESCSPASSSSRHLSASLRVCDLYQCIHQQSSASSHPQIHTSWCGSRSRPGSQSVHEVRSPSQSRDSHYLRRFSDTEANLNPRFQLGRSASFDRESEALRLPTRNQPNFGELVWNPAPSRNSSLSSASQASSAGTCLSVTEHSTHEDIGDQGDHDMCEPRHSSNAHDSGHEGWVDLGNPCCRHHHRRNSTAIKFRKALYEEPE
ncbi:LADA_0B05864g1_1 [Lachancea dasiensis]|uniref:LADA_0B05864g1_1 n=1 Tax=Lachancea dasiensis TaxID=1072105 RepID=A0A1G4IU29_9SACH|nr:LADA_0B05864g1_1 [Lachancea dasiensis]